MVIKKSVKNLISMFLESNAVTQPFSLCVCLSVCLSWFFLHPDRSGLARMSYCSLSGHSFPEWKLGRVEVNKWWEFRCHPNSGCRQGTVTQGAEEHS